MRMAVGGGGGFENNTCTKRKAKDAS